MNSPIDWHTRAENDADIPAVHAINHAAFDRAEEADLVDALRDNPAWIDGLSLVSTLPDDTPVGYALLTRCHVDTTPALCLGPCAVLPEYQKTGAGSAAIRAGLAVAARMGERFVIVLGHPTYYPRFGFGKASEHGIGLTIEVPDEALMALTLTPAHPLPRGTVRYAEPFGID
ncbi:GNAT family N-acetyltransferase [Nocardia sp. NBC_00881]|uniref:GNAT family N-acetyltransferase n=1 Tax=Nocardia sp. NBC_00881 TaxID=2975995 RepID=UPI00386BA9AD